MSGATPLLWIFGLLAATAVGSFTNVVIDRLPKSLDAPNEFGDLWDTHSWGHVFAGRSRCSACGTPIAGRDLIPIVSWLLLRGRCRRCDVAFGSYHLLVELAVPAAGAGAVAALGWGWPAGLLLWLIPAAIAVSVIDLQVFMVPTRVVWPTLAGSVVLSLIAAVTAGPTNLLLSGLFGVVGLAGPLAVLWFALPGGMGFGDVRLAVLLGWTIGVVGQPDRPVAAIVLGLLAMGIAALVGLVIGIVAMGARGMKAKVPFGPALVIGAYVTCLASAALVDWVQ